MQTRNSDKAQATEVRETDYEDEVAADQLRAETHSVSTAYAPDTARQLRKGAIVLACVLIVALLLVRGVGFFHGAPLPPPRTRWM